MKLKLITYLFSIFTVFSCFGQVTFQLVNEFSTSATRFTTDNLKKIYLVENNQVFKLNYSGDTLFTYSDKTLGNITSIDVSNTLRPLLFFKGNAQIVVTDNTLSAQQASYKLEELNLYQTQLIASSLVDNGIWIYDQELFQLIKVNTSFERIYESGNLEQLLQKDSLTPSQLTEDKGKVYLTSPNHGVLVFDIYGSYIKTIPVKDVQQIQVANGNIYYQKNDKYYVYNELNFEETEIILPEVQIKSVRLEKDHLIIQSLDKISIYSIEGK